MWISLEGLINISIPKNTNFLAIFDGSGFFRTKCFLAIVGTLKRFFSAGLIEQRDSQPLLRLMESVGDWPVAFEDWNSTMGRSKSAC